MWPETTTSTTTSANITISAGSTNGLSGTVTMPRSSNWGSSTVVGSHWVDDIVRRMTDYDEFIDGAYPREAERLRNDSEINRGNISFALSRIDQITEILYRVCDLLADIYERDRLGRDGNLASILAYINSIEVREEKNDA